MAFYDTNKIKSWYDIFSSCKSDFNNRYNSYKGSYVVSCNDSTINRMQKKLDSYFGRISNAYSKIQTQWKDFYTDLVNTDAALAGEKSSGSVKSPTTNSRISSMPELMDFKVESLFNNAILSSIKSAAVNVLNVSNESIKDNDSNAGSTLASGVVTGAKQATAGATNLNVSDDISESANTSSASKTAKTLMGAASGAAIGSVICPGLGTLVGGVVGAVVSTDGAVSKIKDWFKNLGNSIKETFNNLKETAKKVVTDLKGLSEADSVKDVLNVFERVGATVATGVTSLVEGVAKLVEDVVDLVALVGTAVASVVTGIADLGGLITSKITGNEAYKTSYTKQMWEKTRSFVATDYVGNAFDSFYENTSAGQWMKNNAYGFDTVRSVGSAVGEVLGVIAITVVTAGVGGAALGTASSVGAGISAAAASTAVTSTGAAITYGLLKTAEHTETNWQDQNTSTAAGLFKGMGQGALDGLFFYAGAKGDQALRNSAKSIINNVGKDASKSALNAARKQAVQKLAGKMAFEGGTAVAQDFSSIGLDVIFSKDVITDENGNVIKFNSIGDKIKYYYDKAGGTQGVVSSLLTAVALSGIADRADSIGIVNKAVRQGEKNTIRQSIKNVVGDTTSKIKNKMDNSALKQKVTDSVSNLKNKVHANNLKISYAFDQLKASANLKLTSGAIAGTSKILDLKDAIKNFNSNVTSKIKNKVDTSTVKQKVTDSVSNIKNELDNSKVKFSNIKSSFGDNVDVELKNLEKEYNDLLSWKASEKFKLDEAMYNVYGDKIGGNPYKQNMQHMKELEGKISKLKNSSLKQNLDNPSKKQKFNDYIYITKNKFNDSITNTKNKINTAKNIINQSSSNFKNYVNGKFNNINLKITSNLKNVNYKLSSGLKTLSGTAINLKTKLKSIYEYNINKIKAKKMNNTAFDNFYANQSANSQIYSSVSSSLDLPESIVELVDVSEVYARYGRLNDNNRDSVLKILYSFDNKIQKNSIGNMSFAEYVLNSGIIKDPVDIKDFIDFYNNTSAKSGISNLTVNEVIAIYNYTKGSSNIQSFVGNNLTWNPPKPYNLPYAPIKNAQEAYENVYYLDSALSKGNYLSDDQLFFSGLEPDKLKLWGIGKGTLKSVYDDLKSKIGKEITVHNYISTSPFKEGSFNQYNVEWRIKAFKGQQPGTYVNEISHYVNNDDEYEYLLKRNLKYKPIDVRMENGKVVVDLEIVD